MTGSRIVTACLFGVASFCIATTASAAGPQVAFETSMGRIVVELDPEHAPVTSRNFLRYVDEGHYDGTVFHRVVEDFVIQGGGMAADLREKPTHEPIINEARNGLSNVTGSIAMARETAIESSTAQFYINVVDNLRLDHVEVPPEGVTVIRREKPVFITQLEANRVYGYAVFGRVVEGLDVVERIRHVAVQNATSGTEELENVPVEPVIIQKAVRLPTNR